MSNPLKPRFKGYEARVRQSLRDQPFMHEMLKAEATRIEPGLVEITVPVQDNLLQPRGNIHGIIASAAADSAAGYAAQTLLAEGFDVVTVEYKINHLAPGVGEKIIAIGKVVRAGRTLSVCTADVFALLEGERTMFAHFITTMMAIEVK